AACLALAAGTSMARTSPLRGVIEGYYGRPWPADARREVIRFLGAHGMNAFVYGPKNDPYHRDRWREPYPDDALRDLRTTAAAARRRALHLRAHPGARHLLLVPGRLRCAEYEAGAAGQRPGAALRALLRRRARDADACRGRRTLRGQRRRRPRARPRRSREPG